MDIIEDKLKNFTSLIKKTFSPTYFISDLYEIQKTIIENIENKDLSNNIYTLESKILEYLGDFEKQTMNSRFPQSTKWCPYWEILYLSESEGIYYDYVSLENNATVIKATDLYLEDQPTNIIINDQRFYIFDMSIVTDSVLEDTEEFPSIKKINFKDKSTGEKLNCSVKIKKITSLSASQSSELYTEKQIDRSSIFVYYPKTTIYILADTINKKIYVMQTCSNANNLGDFKFSDETLPFLGDKLNLPYGWIYTNVSLDTFTCIFLISTAEHRAKVINDDFDNSYQYAREEEAQFLYDDLFS